MKPVLFEIPGPWRGKLAVVTRPRGGDWLPDEVKGWRDAGIGVIVSLLENPEAVQLGLEEEGGIAESQGIEFLSFPIPDREIPASMKEALRLVNHMTTALAAGCNVAVHCRQGIGRSGLIASASLIASGAPVCQAIDVVSKSRGLPVPETPAQLQWLTNMATEYVAPAV